MPPGATSIRAQTVTPDAGPFWILHKRMEHATGSGVLVNTSFNGFHEPIVCSPRDAVSVFLRHRIGNARLGAVYPEEVTDRRTSCRPLAGRSFNRNVTLVALTANFYAISSVD